MRCVDRRGAVASVAAALLTSMPPWPAVAEGSTCAFPSLATLPDTLSEVQAAGVRGDFKGAKALLDTPLLSDAAALTSSLESCAAPTEQGAAGTKETMRALAALREEVEYQSNKFRDPRWPDPDDQADLLQATRRASRAMERYLADIPEDLRKA